MHELVPGQFGPEVSALFTSHGVAHTLTPYVAAFTAIAVPSPMRTRRRVSPAPVVVDQSVSGSLLASLKLPAPRAGDAEAGDLLLKTGEAHRHVTTLRDAGAAGRGVDDTAIRASSPCPGSPTGPSSGNPASRRSRAGAARTAATTACATGSRLAARPTTTAGTSRPAGSRLAARAGRAAGSRSTTTTRGASKARRTAGARSTATARNPATAGCAAGATRAALARGASGACLPSPTRAARRDAGGPATHEPKKEGKYDQVNLSYALRAPKWKTSLTACPRRS